MIKIGDVVIYKLSRQDEEAWPAGAQAHIGNAVDQDEQVPLVVTNVWDNDLINGQALLDGSDSFWVTSAANGDGPGEWVER